MQRTLGRAVAGIAVFNVALAVLNAGSGLLAARLLGPQGRGELASAQALGGLVATLAVLGLGESVVYFGSRDRGSSVRVLTSATVLCAMSAGVVVPIGIVAVGSLGLESGAQTATQLYCCMGFIFAFGLPGSFYRAEGLTTAWLATRAIGPIAWIASVVIGAALLRDSSTGIVGAFLALQTLALAVLWHRVWRTRGLARPAPRLLAPSLFRYSWPLLLSSLPAMVSLRLDQIYLAARVSSAELGIYATAAAWSALAVPLVGSVGNAVFPLLAGDDAYRRLEFLRKTLSMTVVVSSIVCGVQAALSSVAVPLLFGSKFRSGTAAAAVLCLAAIFLCSSANLVEILRGMGLPKAVLRAEISGAVVTVGALLILLPRWGLVGAAWASFLGYGSATAVQIRSLSRSLAVSPWHLLRPRRSDYSAQPLQRVLTNRRKERE